MQIKKLAAIGALGAFAVAGSALANEGMEKQGSQMGQAQSQKQVTMKVKSVDQAANRVTFEAELSPTASIKDERQQDVSISRLQEGDEVRASFDQSGDIVELQVLPSGQEQQQQQQQQPSQPSPGMEPEPSFPEETY